jgi:thymidine phosphorylase
MAWYLKGMNARELSTLTNTMTFSGKNSIRKLKVSKLNGIYL